MHAAGHSLCGRDGKIATVGELPGSALIVDMGQGNQIVDRAGYDLCFYELVKSDGTILLDQSEISVAQDDGSGRPAEFSVEFVWGDTDSGNNGSIPRSYAEKAEQLIQAEDLMYRGLVCIDIGNDDGQAYRFVRFRSYPIDAQPGRNLGVEIDAVLVAPEDLPLPSAINASGGMAPAWGGRQLL